MVLSVAVELKPESEENACGNFCLQICSIVQQTKRRSYLINFAFGEDYYIFIIEKHIR